MLCLLLRVSVRLKYGIVDVVGVEGDGASSVTSKAFIGSLIAVPSIIIISSSIHHRHRNTIHYHHQQTA
jgi:hypothetical protein